MDAMAFAGLYATIEEILEQPTPLPQRLLQLAAYLRDNVGHYDWVGFYLITRQRPGELTLGPFAGAKTDRRTIGFGTGLCGRAAESGTALFSNDAAASEAAVPMIFDGVLRGVLGVNCQQPAPFSDTDRIFLENVADLVALRLSL